MHERANASEADLRIETASVADLAAAVAVQHRAFERVARWLGLTDSSALAPIAETVADVERLVAEEGVVVLVARQEADAGSPVVGTVRGAPRPDGSVEIGRLAVDDGLEGRGIGRALMVAVEGVFPEAERFTLFTGKDAEGPIRLYESLGYRIFGEEEFRPGVFLVWMEMCRRRRVDSTA